MHGLMEIHLKTNMIQIYKERYDVHNKIKLQ